MFYRREYLQRMFCLVDVSKTNNNKAKTNGCTEALIVTYDNFWATGLVELGQLQKGL